MPDRHGKTADVRPIYRRGDRVLVCIPAGTYKMEIRASEVIDGEVWFYGRRACLIMPFPAACIVRRLTADEWQSSAVDEGKGLRRASSPSSASHQ